MPKNELEQYLQKFPKRQPQPIPSGMVADLRKMGKYASKGQPLSIKGVMAFLGDKYQFKCSPMRFRNILESNGIKPWFSA